MLQKHDNYIYQKEGNQSPRAILSTNHTMVYSINRATGWRFGVHLPYIVMKQSMDKIQNFGYYPLAILMIRDPFDRYVSEILKWTDHKEKALDWSVDFSKLELKFEHFFQQNRLKDNNSQLLFMFANLSNDDFILPNRQIKMIGGQSKYFHMDYDPDQTYGSRWQVDSNTESKDYLDQTLLRAWEVIIEEDGVLLGIHEQFEEFLCVLEIIFGAKYQFLWNNQVHTHEPLPKISKRTGRHKNGTIKKLPNVIERSHYEEYDHLFNLREIWEANNQHDTAFYEQAKAYFNLQFQFYLQQLRTQFGIHQEETTSSLHADTVKKIKYQHPHCISFL